MAYECNETIYHRNTALADHSKALKLARLVSEKMEGDAFPWTSPCVGARVRPGGGRMVEFFANRCTGSECSTKEDADFLMDETIKTLTNLGIDTDEVQMSVTLFDNKTEMRISVELKSQEWTLDEWAE